VCSDAERAIPNILEEEAAAGENTALEGEPVLNIGWPADLTWYKLLTDWGSLIGGVFALRAGAALYIGGRQQVEPPWRPEIKRLLPQRKP
jgi:hypothetical protein